MLFSLSKNNMLILQTLEYPERQNEIETLKYLN